MNVAAVVPVHDHERWVADAVRSVAAQDHRPLRLVVVDDGSTDGSLDRVLSLMDQYASAGRGPVVARGRVGDVPTTVLRYEQAAGPAAARNRGMEAEWAWADAFALLDSDDAYAPSKVSRSVARLAASPDVGAVYSDYDTVTDDGTVVRQYKEPFCRRRLLQECIVNCDSVVRKSALEAVGVFDESLRTCEDYDLWLRLSERYLLSHLAEPLVTIRVGPHSSSATVPTETWRRCHARVFEKLRERRCG